jgi:Uma2 family endonuclease
MDVRIKAKTVDDMSDNTVFKPDLLVSCDKSKRTDKSLIGAPEMIIEVLSPSDRIHDTYIKFNAYRDAGVREYWMVDPQDRTVFKCVLSDGNYLIEVFDQNSNISVSTLPGLMIDFSSIYTIIDTKLG